MSTALGIIEMSDSDKYEISVFQKEEKREDRQVAITYDLDYTVKKR